MTIVTPHPTRFASVLTTLLESAMSHAGVESIGNVHLIRPYVMTARCRHDSDAPSSTEHRAADLTIRPLLRTANQRGRLLSGRDSGGMLRSAWVSGSRRPALGAEQ